MVDATNYLYKVVAATNSGNYYYFGITTDYRRRFAEHKNYCHNKALRELAQHGAYLDCSVLATEVDRHLIEELEELCIAEAKSIYKDRCLNVLAGSPFTGASSQIGSSHWNASFSEKDIADIREIYLQGGITQEAIGEIYGCSNKVISKITTGSRWNNVDTKSGHTAANRVANRRKLTDEQVLEIRTSASIELHNTGKLNTKTISDKYNISQHSLRLVLTGKSYSNLAGPIFMCIDKVWKEIDD